MAHGHIKEFDPTKETIDDFRQRFEFYCTANNIKSDDEAQQARKKALFITMLGQTTFVKLRDLASPNDITTLSLDQVIELLTAHYRPQIIEIAERYKFFKRTQEDQERTTDFIAALRRLAMTCKFGQYLDTALRDQFVCGLNDRKCQRELLSTQELTLQTAIQKATAAETATRESRGILGASAERMASKDLHKMTAKPKCIRCGRTGHQPTQCKYKTFKCHKCQKVGHLASVCRSKQPADRRDKDTISGQRIGSVQETVDSNDDYSSDSSGYLHNILQLGTRANKFLLTVNINSIPIEMEVDSGAERSTVPLSLFEQRLSGVCKLKPSRVSLYQYDKSPLTIAGECQATVRINSRVISAVFVVVDVQKQFPLLGRDWMALLNFDLISLMTQATAIHQTTADVVKNDLMEEFAEVFQNELGVLRGIEATVAVNESAAPRFHKARPVPFALKEKVERQLQQQVLEGELVPVDRSDWATPIVVVHKKDGGIRICGDFKVSINLVLQSQTYPLPTPEEMFSALTNGESYIKLDLARAYKQMKVKEECQPLLTINTHRGLYRYTRLPFGITTAPSLWQRAMAQVLSGISKVAYYIDDILITGCTRAEHIENLRMVLCRLREYGLKLKHSKCEFFAKDLEFLGHRISPEGVKPTAERIASIRKAPAPTNKQELKSFLGMLTYNARFLPNVSHTLYRGVRHSVKSRTPSVKSLKSKFEIVKSTHKREIASWY